MPASIVVSTAEVAHTPESSRGLQAMPDAKNLYLEYHSAESAATLETPILRFSWRIENFVAFKEIMETRKIFSKYAAERPHQFCPQIF